MTGSNLLPQGEAGDDAVRALSWVSAEVANALEAALKAVRRTLKEAEALRGSDVAAADLSALRAARGQFHQVAGVLEMVGRPALSRLPRALEEALQRVTTKPALLDSAAVEVIERACFGVVDAIEREVGGRGVTAVALFPQYAAVQQLAGAERVHPADLWEQPWRWCEVEPDPSVAARTADASARQAMEPLILALMRQADAGPQRAMSDLCAGLAAAGSGRERTLWSLAAAVFEAQAGGLLVSDAHVKRIAARLLSVLRQGLPAEGPAGRLALDLLFFCARSRRPSQDQPAPRLGAVLSAFGLLDQAPLPAYDVPRLGRFDPAWVQQARKRVSSAREAWSAIAGEDLLRLASLPEPFALVADSLVRLYPNGQHLAQALNGVAVQTAQSGRPPAPELAMEVATAVLYLEASLEDADLESEDLGERIARLARRIDEVRRGAAPAPLEPWMEDVYRRVSDRQTMGNVVLELRQSLAEVEKQVDPFFRDPSRSELLNPVPGLLLTLRGVLSVLGMDPGARAVGQLREDVEALVREGQAGQSQPARLFDRVADNLSALSFMVDVLGVQPRLARSLFVFDPVTGRLQPVMGLAVRPAEPLPPAAVVSTQDAGGLAPDTFAGSEQAEPAPSTDRAALPPVETVAPALPLQEPAAGLTLEWPPEAVGEPPAPQPPPIPAVAPAFPPPPVITEPLTPALVAPELAPAPGEDDEMREIFLEEAREVIEGATAALSRLSAGASLHALEDLTEIRRAFHTLKGSSRMVGLRGFGEAAWACEQLYNTRLAAGQEAQMDASLRELTTGTLQTMSGWVEAIAGRMVSDVFPGPVVEAADLLRTGARPTAPAPLDALPAPEPQAAVLPVEPSEPIVPLEPVEPEPGLEIPPLSLATETLALTERVPDLPSAADLDLSFAPTAEVSRVAEGEEAKAEAEAVADDEAVADAASAAAAEPPPSTEVPAAAVEVQELAFTLDLGDFAAEPTGPAPPQAPAPEPLAEPVQTALTAEATEPGSAVEATEAFVPPQTVEAFETLETFVSLDAAVELSAPVAPEVLGVAEEDLGAPIAEPPQDVAPVDESREAVEPLPAVQPELDNRGLDDEDEYKQIGPLQVEIGMFNIFLSEADELSRRLGTELAEWAMAGQGAPPDSAVALAHSLAGCSGTVGYAELSTLARSLEHALGRAGESAGHDGGAAGLFAEAADEARRLLHQFAAGFLPPVAPGLVDRLEAYVPPPPAPEPAPPPEAETVPSVLVAAEPPSLPAAEAAEPPPLPLLVAAEPQAQPEAEQVAEEAPEEEVDTVDADLFPIFADEAAELLPQLQSRMQDWLQSPFDAGAAAACMRTLHTFKGGARLSGAMRLGEAAHRLETAIERLTSAGGAHAAQIEPLLADADWLQVHFEALRDGKPVPTPPAPPPPALPPAEPLPAPGVAAAPDAASAVPATEAPPAAPSLPQVDWGVLAETAQMEAASPDRAGTAPATAVRVRAPLLEHMVNQAGEVSISRARIEVQVGHLRGALVDLTDNLERLRRQLRDIEVQAESQINSRMEAARSTAQGFDPLEMDRFTRFQELTRMMAESVNDVATIHRGLQKALQVTEDELAAQARLTRSLQDDLMSTRMLEFESLADRLHRVVRLAARDTGKQARLEIVGGNIEMDRGVLERMTGPFEHLLRNSVAHGVEPPAQREAAGKDRTGTLTIALTQEGNEVALEFRDDGAGLDLPRIRSRAIERGLLQASAEPTQAELASMIFASGFSTASAVTELAGRGVGLDVVRAEVMAMGGRIETSTSSGQGSTFRLVLPLTTAVTQVVLLRCGEITVAVPSTLVEGVRRADAELLERCYETGHLAGDGGDVEFFWLASLLGDAPRGATGARGQAIVSVRSAAQRVALHVEEVVGNQEVVVKHLGPQLSRLPGLTGVTLLPSGLIAPIYNPVALAGLHGAAVRERLRGPRAVVAAAAATPPAEPLEPLVLVVDDSLTVRRVTQRLLEREGYRVATAKDGLDALERLAEEKPSVVLSDIEMPRMDGFDLVRNLRSDARLADLAVIMITSRIAQKHREYAAQLGVDHYLGKPYSEDELLSLVGRYARGPQQRAS